jgi:hypothetical protein
MTRQLGEPIEVAKFWKNRRGEAIVVRLFEYEGRVLIDRRTWFAAADGVLKPGKRLTCSVRHLPAIAAALNRAPTVDRPKGTALPPQQIPF